MPKILPNDIDGRIVTLVGRSPGGSSFKDIFQSLASVISERSLHRKLNTLVKRRRLIRIGKARAATYKLATITADGDITLPAFTVAGEVETYVPMSEGGSQVRAYVRQPIQNRKPVAYHRDFLEHYQPNATFYLTPDHRAHLHQIGRSPDGERPAGTYARDILGRLLIDLSWASSRLEGNTYTRLETQRLIEFGVAPEGKDRIEAQMILNHKAAIEMLVENVDDVGFNTFTFFNLHSLLSDNLLADPAASGRIRHRVVEINGTTYHPLAIPQQIGEYFRLLLEKAGTIDDPFEQAFFLMVQIPYLQPFEDVNKRVSRLGANIPLIKQNLCPLSFVDVPERAYFEGTLGIYELNRIDLLRDVFLWAYERSCQRFLAVRETMAMPDPVRLRQREALASVVGDIVRSMTAPTQDAIWKRASSLVPEKDIDRFVELAREDLARLHEGNIARYRLKLAEYRAWEPLQREESARTNGR